MSFLVRILLILIEEFECAFVSTYMHYLASVLTANFLFWHAEFGNSWRHTSSAAFLEV